MPNEVEVTLSKLDSIIHSIQDGQIEYSLADCRDDLLELSDEVENLTAKLDEAVELLNKTTGQLHKLKDFIVSPLEIDMVCKTVKRNDDFLQAIKQIKE